MGTMQARPIRSRRRSWIKKAVLSTRNRKDGAFGGEEEEETAAAAGESEREETQPAAPGDLLWLQEDTDTSLTKEQTAACLQTAAALPTDFT